MFPKTFCRLRNMVFSLADGPLDGPLFVALTMAELSPLTAGRLHRRFSSQPISECDSGLFVKIESLDGESIDQFHRPLADLIANWIDDLHLREDPGCMTRVDYVAFPDKDDKIHRQHVDLNRRWKGR